MKKGIIFIAIMLLLAGCGKKEAVPTSNDVIDTGVETADSESDATVTLEEGHLFEYKGVTIPVNMDAAPILEALGEPVEYFEAPSCAFQGLDKIYYYNGFELSTYPSEEKDFISTINFLDDSVNTDKGVYLGSTLEKVIAAYGEDYTENSGSYTYQLGESKLTFITEDDIVASITYFAVVEGLNN